MRKVDMAEGQEPEAQSSAQQRLSESRLSQLFDPILSMASGTDLLGSPSNPEAAFLDTTSGYRYNRLSSDSIGSMGGMQGRLSGLSLSSASSIHSLLSEAEVAEAPAAPQWANEANINWQERCLELELALQKYRDQAGQCPCSLTFC